MIDSDPTSPPTAKRYREMAQSVRNLIPHMEHAEVRDQLGALALQYERLAEGVETVSDSLRVLRLHDTVEQNRSGS